MDFCIERDSFMMWFYTVNGQQREPVNEPDLVSLFASGEIDSETLVWKEGMSDWARYADIPHLREQSSGFDVAEGGSVCSICGRNFHVNEMIVFEGSRVCAECKPGFIQRIKENSEIPQMVSFRYAGFWIRFVAVFIDGIFMNIIVIPFRILMTLGNTSENMALTVFSTALYFIVAFLVPALYSILMLGKYGATLGKKAVGIKVVMSDGTPISYGCATGRYFATFLSGIILYIGYIIVAFDDEKRALHDHICNTRVIYK